MVARHAGRKFREIRQWPYHGVSWRPCYHRDIVYSWSEALVMLWFYFHFKKTTQDLMWHTDYWMKKTESQQTKNYLNATKRAQKRNTGGLDK